MKPALSMWSLEAEITKHKWSQSDFIRWAWNEKIKTLELVSYYLNRENDAAATKKLLDELDMTVSCYTILNDFVSDSEACMEDFIKDLNNAVELGAPFVRVLTGDANSLDAAGRGKMIQRFSRAASEAAKNDIILILENIGGLSGHSEEAVGIIEEVNSPNLRINFDTANPLLADEEPVQALKTMLPYVAYVHLKDFITEDSAVYNQYSEAEWRIQTSRKGRKMTGITPGKGEIDLVDMLKILEENQYDGYISVEYENDIDVESAVRDSIRFIEEYVFSSN